MKPLIVAHYLWNKTAMDNALMVLNFAQIFNGIIA